MSNTEEKNNVLNFRKADGKKAVSFQERIWGKAVLQHGYTAIPSVLI